MLLKLQRLFTELLDHTDASAPTQQVDAVALATVALLIEISLADAEQQEQELQMIKSIARTTFGLDEQKLCALIEAAQSEVEQAVSIHGFTRVLNDRLSRKERVAVIEQLWRLAYADRLLDKYEEYYIRKIADLLHIAHADYIKAKHTAMPG